jgi:hypothetical protein
MAIVNCGYNPPSKAQAKAAVEVDCGFNPRSQAAKAAESASVAEAPTEIAPTRKRAAGVRVHDTA